MKRNILRKLQEWRRESPRKPLIINGVRQCGKTHVLTEFAQKEFSRHHYFNFEQKRELHDIFQGDFVPRQMLRKLSFVAGQDINTKHDLVIFDEIQACPKALTALKYFAEQQSELAIACAGSLLGLSLGDSSFPVGKVTQVRMYPMTFGEFLAAMGDHKALELIKQRPWDEETLRFAHPHLWERFTWYLVTGGLPEIVSNFVAHQDRPLEAFQRVREQQYNLLNAYFADIAKHAGKVNAMHIERVLQDVPRQLARKHDSQAPRFQFRDVVPGVDRYQHLVGAIDWLIKAGLVIQVPVISHCEIPLNAQVKQSLFKLYCFDVGMLGAMNGLAPKALLDYEFGTYKGYVAENFVAQMFATQNTGMFCWEKDRSEVEFVIEDNDKVLPVEVKAGQIQKAKSLEKLMALYELDRALLLNGLPVNTRVAEKIELLPLYLAEFIELG